MSNEYYKIILTDYASPGFSSHSKDYYGTFIDIEKFIKAIETNPNIEDDIDGLIVALDKYKSGNYDCKHSVAYWEEKFVIPVKIIKKSFFATVNFEWGHKNIWGCSYFMRAEILELEQILLKEDKRYFYCVRPKITNLAYTIDNDDKRWLLLNGVFWGFPETLTFDKIKNITRSRLYCIGSIYSNEDDALLDFGRVDSRVLQAFCNDIFADG